MKKLIAMLLVLAMLVCLAACGGGDDTPTTTEPTGSTDPTGGNDEPVTSTPLYGLDNPAGDASSLVSTDAGQIQGTVDNGIYTYKGIPYAQALERFKPAVDVAWDNVFNATAYGPISLQQSMGMAPSYSDGSGEAVMDNNCQNLNIWTPGINDDEQRPVMVWLHGGAFTSGASSTDAAYDGTNLSEFGDVVVVSINHRLNVMGYLDLSEYGDEYRYSGNVGQMDIVMALEWIHENIAAFGGDPDNVTIFGESGGGAKVLALMATPSAEGLFHKAIVESGTTDVVGPTVAPQEAARLATELTLEALDITEENIEDLQTMDFDTLLTAATTAMTQTNQQIDNDIEWGPVVDGDFMPTHPVAAEGFAESGRDVTLMIGTNLSEWTGFGLGMGSGSGGGGIDEMTEAEVLEDLAETYGDNAQAVLDAFKEAYPNEYVGHALYVDTMIRQPSLKVAEHKAAQGGAPVYSYVYSWEASGTELSNHMTEIAMVFHNAETAYPGNEAALVIENMMAQTWVNFARNGDPSTDGLTWEAFDSENRATAILDTIAYVAHGHDTELLELMNPGYEYFPGVAE